MIRAAPLGPSDGTHWAVGLGARGMRTGGVGVLPQAPGVWRTCPHPRTAPPPLLFLPGNKTMSVCKRRSAPGGRRSEGDGPGERGGEGRGGASSGLRLRGPDSQ